MSKYCADLALDAMLNYVKNNSFFLVACTSATINYDTAMGSCLISRLAITSALFSGPINGVSAGRRLIVAATSAVASVAGTATNILLLSSAGASSVIYITDVSAGQAVSLGSPVTFGGWEILVDDPA